MMRCRGGFETRPYSCRLLHPGISTMISPLDGVRIAVGALRVNVMRSLLTMLGIIIGVGAVIVMVAVGAGAREMIGAADPFSSAAI